MNTLAANRGRPRGLRILGWAALPLLWMLLHAGVASAVPSYARQTHQPCAACHVGGFGPELTAFGRQFKLSGYTMKVGNDTKVPLSAMLVESFTHTKAPQDPADLGKPFSANNNVALDQASVFVAGRISDHLGVFSQFTYSQVGGLFGWDNIDVRYANKFNSGGHHGVWGISVNNNPTVSDLFNSAPAWMFPYMAGELAPGGDAAPNIFDGLGGQSIGATFYLDLDSHWYLEAGGYKSLSPAFLDKVNAGSDGHVSGVAPYARIAYTWRIPHGDFTLGTFMLNMNRNVVPGPTDNYDDLGLSGDYQYIKGDNTFTANALYMHERQKLNASYLAGDSTNLNNNLDSMNLKGSYWYKNTYGVSLASFSYTGSQDANLYGGSPNTQGGVVEFDYNPFGKRDSWAEPYANLRVGLQYTFFSKVNGQGGSAASGDNTTYLYLWFAL